MSLSQLLIKNFCITISGIFLLWGAEASAATVHTITNLPTRQPHAVPVHKIKRITYIVRSFDSRTLYLKNGKKYDLQNVQVSDFGGIGKDSKLAEMTFVDNKLKDVVIRNVR
ncbi:MAG: hypothetical protein CSYNP_00392 [Syntrophus sp. SKADARSKE-3]|nr:hypothetical protein [Syntrophus sp. SKADARSKE-3]